MKEILEGSTQVPPFQAASLYPSPNQLEFLQLSFTLCEIHEAVTQLANGKASGPDGLPNEFLKIYWPEVQNQILAISHNFYNNNLDLLPFNEAKIVMVPKCDSPLSTSDYRPISVLNLIPKLVAMVLSKVV